MKPPKPLPADHSLVPLRDDELDQLAGWAAAEGWNPGASDIAIARRIDPAAFVGLRHHDELVGAGAVFRVNPAFGFMGLFIVRKDRRGAGLGRALWHHRRDLLISRLRSGATIGMDGVFEMVPFYQAGGFRLAHRDLRFEGIASGALDCEVDEASVEDYPAIHRLDTDLFGAERLAFLDAWLTAPGIRTAVLRQGQRVSAVAVLRPAQAGYRFGPVLAQTPELAWRVMTHLMAAVAGERVQLDVPEPNARGLALARAAGLTEVFGCARMYYGPMPQVDVQRIFGVTSFEFG